MRVTASVLSFSYFVAMFLSVILSIMAVSVVFWARQSSDNDDNYYGIFLRESTHQQVASLCNSGMTEMECGYLKSAKACSVISIIFGGAACLMYLVSCGDTGFGFYTFSMGTVGFIQSIFGIMCVVIFSYFKESYLTSNDDVNIEYPDHAEVEYGWAFYLLISSVVLSFSVSVLYLALLMRQPASLKRSRSADPLFNTYEA